MCVVVLTKVVFTGKNRFVFTGLGMASGSSRFCAGGAGAGAGAGAP